MGEKLSTSLSNADACREICILVDGYYYGESAEGRIPDYMVIDGHLDLTIWRKFHPDAMVYPLRQAEGVKANVELNSLYAIRRKLDPDAFMALIKTPGYGEEYLCATVSPLSLDRSEEDLALLCKMAQGTSLEGMYFATLWVKTGGKVGDYDL